MRKVRLLFFGDSITAGSNDETFRGWPSRLCEMAASTVSPDRFDFYQLGLGGDTSLDTVQRIAFEAPPRIKDRIAGIVVMTGVNDAARAGSSFDSTRYLHQLKNFVEILSCIRELKGVPQLWIEPTPVHPRLDWKGGATGTMVNNALKSISLAQAAVTGRQGWTYLPMAEALSSSQVFLKSLSDSDGVHPTASGYQLIARQIQGSDTWNSWLNTLLLRQMRRRNWSGVSAEPAIRPADA